SRKGTLYVSYRPSCAPRQSETVSSGGESDIVSFASMRQVYQAQIITKSFSVKAPRSFAGSGEIQGKVQGELSARRPVERKAGFRKLGSFGTRIIGTASHSH